MSCEDGTEEGYYSNGVKINDWTLRNSLGSFTLRDGKKEGIWKINHKLGIFKGQFKGG